ncbi:MAG: glycosyltransferase [candidate division Zixibacteria bacterium]|nr:glycosyltransferase [candidate division Zixibacteria bacterium]
MKVLLLADGRSVHTIRYQKELQNQGIRIFLASLEPGEMVDIALKNKTPFNSLNYFLAAYEIRKLIHKLNPDVVNAHFASGYGFSVARCGIWESKPVLLHCLGSDILISPGKSFLHKRRVIRALSRASHIVVDSGYLADQVRRLSPADKMSIIPWGVEDEILRIFESKGNLTLNNAKTLKVLVPRPHHRIYNNLFIVEALKDFIKSKNISLVFPDWGRELKGFRKGVAQIVPGDLINYYSYMPREKYLEFIADFDIHLSAAISDSSPASLIEAMGAGMFPVVADIYGVKEWVNDKNALLFNPFESASLHRAFEYLLTGRLPVKDILMANHQKIKEKAVFSENIRATISIMEKMIADAA